MRIALVTDAWQPQTNGVVTTLRRTAEELAREHELHLVTPDGMPSLPCPSYPEIRLALPDFRGIARRLDAFRPEAVHLATEGPLGWTVRAYCAARGLAFTSSYHTQFPEYVRARWPIPLAAGYGYMRAFHGPAVHTLVGTEDLRKRLHVRGFTGLRLWSRGVDAQLFQPRGVRFFDLPRPIMLYAGRVAVEKNLEAFLALDLPGSKVVVGDGPALADLRRRFPATHFAGYRYGEDLARHIAAADVFVFPSRTDTFGLVMLEAMACGVPVAAFPVTGPLDVVVHGRTGSLREDLARAVREALALDRSACRDSAERHTWQAATQQFLDALVCVHSRRSLRASPSGRIAVGAARSARAALA
jgi:glycosyltransferase involved in cell wall biosynthesis